MMTASVTAVVANRAVQLKRRPIHHNIAQHMTTGTISSGRTDIAPLVWHPAADIDPDGAADFHAGAGALDLHEALAVARTGVAGACALDRLDWQDLA